MSADGTRLSLADLAAAGVRLRTSDAVAIARELVLQVTRGHVPGVPSAHVIRLSRSGTVAVEGPVAAGEGAVGRAAQLLDSLLPEKGAGSKSPEFKVPGALRLCLVRALGNLDVPPYASLESFADALERFAAPDAQAAIRALVEAWRAASHDPAPMHGAIAATAGEISSGPSAAPGDSTGRPETPRRDFPRSDRAASSLARGAEPLTISDIRRARRATGLPLAEIATRSEIPIPLLRQLEWGYLRYWPAGLHGRAQLARYARAAGLDDQIVIATVWPMLEEAERARQEKAIDAALAPADRADDSPEQIDVGELPLVHVPEAAPPPRFRRGRAAALAAAAAITMAVAWPLTRDRLGDWSPVPAAPAPTSGLATREAPAVMDVSASSAEAGNRLAGGERRETPQPPPAAEPAAPTNPVAGETRRASLAAGSESPLSEPAHTRADLDSAWSPDLAAAGSAMFHQVRGDEAGPTGSYPVGPGAILRITRIVDDRAQNFHARPSPDGSRIAFDSDRDGERGVYVADADGTNVRRVSGEGFAAIPSWSPDGRRLAFIRAESDRPRVWNLWILDTGTGDLRRLTSHKYGQPWGGSWFPDGRRLVYGHEDGLVVLDIERGRERRYDSPRKGASVRSPAVSPDGHRIIFQVVGDGTWLLDAPDGGMRKVLADPTAEDYTWAPDGRRVAYHSRRSGEWGVWLMASR